VKSIRLLPVVVMAISALLVLKTAGLVLNGSYVLGPTPVLAAGGASSGGAGAPAEGEGSEIGAESTMTDSSPTLADSNPTLKQQPEAGGHGAAAEPAEAGHGAEANEASGAEAEPGEPAAEHGATDSSGDATGGEAACLQPAMAADAGAHGAEGTSSADATSSACDSTAEAVPMEIDAQGKLVPMSGKDGASLAEAAVLERLSGRRGELEAYAEELALRASLVDAAEKRLQERQGALQVLETQIAGLVDKREEMESGQFAGIVAMYETMKPKDAANIFNSLDMNVLLRVAKIMSPRKMAPILAAMEPARAQELTVQMADLADQPATQMSPDNLAELPQIVGQ
jgi:flagellar motility protein MotE (MotC chaperone)